MKKLLLIFVMAFSVGAMQAQVKVDDFESGNQGWTNVACGGDLVANDYKTGINLSDNVYKAVRVPDCDNWSGVLLSPYAQSGYKYLHAYMYRSNMNKPNLKVSDTNAQDLEPVNTIVANQWQDVVWDISVYEQSGIEFIFFMVDRTNISEEAWMLIDEVQLSNDATPRTDVVGGDTPPADEYQLVWNEDFTDASLDQQVWNIEVNGKGGGNNELQYYCEKGVSLGVEPATGKHCLVLTATKENYQGKNCTSGRVNTNQKLTYTFGKIEARIKFPQTANGLWPAFWQLGANMDEVGWPKCGETDLIEMGHKDGFNNRQDRYFNGAMHVGRDWQSVWQDPQASEWAYSLQDTFHIITMIWTPNSIDMYMDKDSHPETGAYFHANLEPNDDPDYNRQLVFGKPNFLIANLAVGGNFPGIYQINGITALADGPRSMYIDWIRIYQRGDVNQSFACSSPSDPIEQENPSGIEEVQSDNVQSTKELRDGQLIIRRGEHVYTITGSLIR